MKDYKFNIDTFREAWPEIYSEIEKRGYIKGLAEGRQAIAAQPPPASEKKLTVEEIAVENWKRDAVIRKMFSVVGGLDEYTRRLRMEMAKEGRK